MFAQLEAVVTSHECDGGYPRVISVEHCRRNLAAVQQVELIAFENDAIDLIPPRTKDVPRHAVLQGLIDREWGDEVMPPFFPERGVGGDRLTLPAFDALAQHLSKKEGP